MKLSVLLVLTLVTLILLKLVSDSMIAGLLRYASM